MYENNILNKMFRTYSLKWIEDLAEKVEYELYD